MTETETISQAAEKLSKIPHAPVAEAPPEVEVSPNPENAAPERPSGETQAQPDPAEPPIEAPASWDDDAKARFGKLPREDQEYLAARERERDVAVRRGQNEAAELRKAAEAERAKAMTEGQQYITNVQYAAQALHQQLLGDFADIKSPADAARIAAEDPARYLAYKARTEQVQAAYQQVAEHNRKVQEQNKIKFGEWVSAEQTKLIDLVPEWKEPAKLQQGVSELRAYAKTQGATDQEANGAWSAAVAVMARKAMLYDKAQEAAKKAKTVPLPKVVRPGTAAEVGEAERTRAADALKSHHKHGSLHSAAAALAARRAAQR